MRWSVILLLGAALAHAENSDTASQGGAASRKLHGVISTFDDRVFDVGNSAPPEARTRRSVGGAERYLDEEANYHSGQRERWMEICEPEKAMGMRAYQACYASERAREVGGRRPAVRRPARAPRGLGAYPPRLEPRDSGGPTDLERAWDPAYDFDIERSYENY